MTVNFVCSHGKTGRVKRISYGSVAATLSGLLVCMLGTHD